MHNYKEKSDKNAKSSFGGGLYIFSATCWGWVTNILCHYEGVGHVFLSNWVFISSGPPHPPVLIDQPLMSEIRKLKKIISARHFVTGCPKQLFVESFLLRTNHNAGFTSDFKMDTI